MESTIDIENRIIKDCLFPASKQGEEVKAPAVKSNVTGKMENQCKRCGITFHLNSSLNYHFYNEHIHQWPRREIIPLYLGGGEAYWL